MCIEVGYKLLDDPDNEWKVIDEVRSITNHFSKLAVESVRESLAEQNSTNSWTSTGFFGS
jgi:hypothetical protein